MSLGAGLRASGMLLEVRVVPESQGTEEWEVKGQRPHCFVHVNYHDLTGTQFMRDKRVSRLARLRSQTNYELFKLT